MQHVAIYKGTFARLLVKRFLQIAGSMQHIAIYKETFARLLVKRSLQIATTVDNVSRLIRYIWC